MDIHRIVASNLNVRGPEETAARLPDGLAFAIAVSLLLISAGARAQTTDERSVPRTAADDQQSEAPHRGAEVLLPVGSVFVPGLGQWFQHEPGSALRYLTAFMVGRIGSRAVLEGRSFSITDFAMSDGRTEAGILLQQLTQDVGALSAYDAFQHSIPALQRGGKYLFLTESETPQALMKAPGEFHFLTRKTTYVPIIGVLALSYTRLLVRPAAGKDFAPVRGRDAAFAAGLSYDAGVGEEALYRGYLLPLFRQHLGDRVWVANGLQSALFAAGHRDFSAVGFASHFGFGLYAGYLANRNQGSLRQVVFNHFLWDLVAVSGSFVTRQHDRGSSSPY